MGNDYISYKCPSYNSENIQKASVLVSLGSKKFEATTVGVGGGSGEINAGIGLSAGSITSELAAKLSPPIKPQVKRISLWKYIIFPFLLLLLANGVVTGFLSNEIAGGIIFLGLFALLVYYGYFRWIPSWKQKQIHQEKEYTRALAQWGKTYFCLRCGSSFEISKQS